jgi:general secretion pathway protein A
VSRRKPFQATVDPDVFFPSESARYVSKWLLAALRERRGLCLLTGEPGTGKTTVMGRVMRTLPQTVIPIVTTAPLEADELVSMIAGALGVAELPTSPGDVLAAVYAALGRQAETGGSVTMAIDEAQALSDDTLERCVQLVPGQTRVQVLLVGQPVLGARLAALSFAGDTPDVAVHCRLEPMAAQEVRDYIAYRLREAAAQPIDLFSPAAIQRIAAVSRGVPRLVNQICEEALVAAPDGGMGVSVGVVDRVAARLDLAEPLPERPHKMRGTRASARRARRRRRAVRSSPWPRRLAAPAVGIALAAVVSLVLVHGGGAPRVGAPPTTTVHGQASPLTITPDAASEPDVESASPGLALPARPTRAPRIADDRAPGPPGPSRADTAQRNVEVAGRPVQTATDDGLTPSAGSPRPPSPSTGPPGPPGLWAGSPRPPGPSASLPASPGPPAGLPARSRTRDSDSEQTLLKRAEDGDAAGIRALLAEGVQPDARDGSGLTPLMLAIIHDHQAAIEVLLGGGARVDTRNEAGQTPLMLAAIGNRPAIIQTLLARGGDINARTTAGWTALMYAAWKGHAEVARALLDRGADPSLTDRTGWTALRYAMWRLSAGTSVAQGSDEPESAESVVIDLGAPTGEDLAARAAAGPGHTEVIEILRGAGQSPRQGRGGRDATVPRGVAVPRDARP